MPLQILTLKLDGVTAGDYPTWCRDPDPPALDFALRSIAIDANPLGDTITVILDWTAPALPATAAAAAAGLPVSAGVQIQPLLIDGSHAGPAFNHGRSRGWWRGRGLQVGLPRSSARADPGSRRSRAEGGRTRRDPISMAEAPKQRHP